MTQKNKTYISLLIFYISFFGFYNYLFAAVVNNCSATASWFVSNNNGTYSPIAGPVVADPNKIYYAVATFSNCQNQKTPTIDIYGGSNSSGRTFTPFVVADSITQSPEAHNVTVKFDQAADYYFAVAITPGDPSFGSGYSLEKELIQSAHITATAPVVPKSPSPTPTPTPAPTDPNATPPTTPTTPKVDCTKTPNDQQNCLQNPLPTDDLLDMLLRIVKGFLLVIGGWAVAFVIIGGFRMVMSQGNDEAYGAAKKTITWAILGLVVALLSFSIVAIVQNLIGANIQPLIK